MPKVKVVFGSTLKPVHEPRFLDKLAFSIGQTNKYEINIIGFSGKNVATPPNITLKPIFNFKRLSLRRFMAPWKFYKLTIKVKPDILIANTYELLVVMILYKILFGAKLLYDVQENYYRNILFNSDLPRILKRIWSLVARSIEIVTSPWIDHYLLAEKHYQQELGFIKKKYTIIENKAYPADKSVRHGTLPRKNIKMLYSGTIALPYGILEAICLTDQLIEHLPGLSLHIIGHCPVRETFNKLLDMASERPYITITGDAGFVDHSMIIEAIKEADFGLLPYHLNPAISDCVPTRLYEYLANQLPYLVVPNPPWIEITHQYQSGLAVDFVNPDLSNLVQNLLNDTFYPQKLPDTLFWPSESKKWIHLMEEISADPGKVI